MLAWGNDDNYVVRVIRKKQQKAESKKLEHIHYEWRVEEAGFYMMIAYTQGCVIIIKYENPKKNGKQKM